MEEHAKLMKPLFIDGNFNREGKRIRAKLFKTIQGEGIIYPLWIDAGKPDNNYPRDENDKYYYYIQCGEWLILTGETERGLIERAGYAYLNKEWYGDFGGRNAYFDNLHKTGTHEESERLIKARLAEENAFIAEHGTSEAAQVAYLKIFIDRSIANYIDARDNGGKRYDFIGAAFLNEIEQCEKIASVIRKEREKERAIKRKAQEEQDRIAAEQRAQAEQTDIEAAETIFVEGGKINKGDIIVKLADKYNVDIPIRTRGWILNTLVEVTIKNNSASCRYWKTKNGNGSTKIYDIVFAIQRAIKEAKAA